MNATMKKGVIFAGLIVAAGALELPFGIGGIGGGIGMVVPAADAQVRRSAAGAARRTTRHNVRPLPAVGVAGVARRTTRRTIRRTTVYIATLPVGCSTVVLEGMTLHQCGTVYYQPSSGKYVVVEVH